MIKKTKQNKYTYLGPKYLELVWDTFWSSTQVKGSLKAFFKARAHPAKLR